VLGLGRWLNRTNTNHTKGTKMEKNQISEMLKAYAFSATAHKSATNRVASALEKSGTPAQLLAGIRDSLKAFSAQVDENSGDYGSAQALHAAFTFAAAIAKNGTEKAKGKTREVWADSQEEAIALKNAQASVKPAKPKREKVAEIKGSTLEEIAQQLAQLLAGR
jgi:hypothetical protein